MREFTYSLFLIWRFQLREFIPNLFHKRPSPVCLGSAILSLSLITGATGDREPVGWTGGSTGIWTPAQHAIIQLWAPDKSTSLWGLCFGLGTDGNKGSSNSACHNTAQGCTALSLWVWGQSQAFGQRRYGAIWGLSQPCLSHIQFRFWASAWMGRIYSYPPRLWHQGSAKKDS